MKPEELDQNYTRYYRDTQPRRVYPTEWAVRAMLGRYPRHRPDKADYPGKTVLDLGFGDGRNTHFLCDLGFVVSGMEITQAICDPVSERLAAQGQAADLRVGRNRQIPFDDNAFDYVLAVHSCYYLDPGDTFDTNLDEICRVLKPGGTFIGSVPMADNHYLDGADDLGGGMRRIRNDLYGVRNGTIVMGMASEEQLRGYLEPRFDDLRLGSWRNDFWGVHENVHLIVARAKGAPTAG